MSVSRMAQGVDSIVENLFMFFPLFYRKILRYEYITAGVNPVSGQFRLLMMLCHTDRLQPSEIGRNLGISKPNVTTLIDKLIEKGYVDRMHDIRDRRVMHIAITDKGRSFISKRKRLLADIMRKNLSALKPGELEELSRALETFKDIVSRMEEPSLRL